MTITPMQPDQIRELELRADRAHPDEPVATAAEVKALIRAVRDTDATAVTIVAQAGRVRGLAREWIDHRDIQIAAAGRILLAALDGRQGALTGT